MRATVILLAMLALPTMAVAAPHASKAAGPQSLGAFNDWQAVTYSHDGKTVCYAFTRPTESSPKLARRDKVMLTVTQRPDQRDAISLSAGFAYPAKADVKVSVGSTELDFFTAGHTAFARDGKAAVRAFKMGNKAVARSPVAKDKTVTDSFSLAGFTAAYNAITKACPAK